MKDFIHFIKEYNISTLGVDHLSHGIESFEAAFDYIFETNPEMYHEAIKGFHEEICGEHFNEYFAKKEVEKMHHTNINREKIEGEHFNHLYAKKIYESNIRHIAPHVTCWDVYVALNAQYHDYIKLFTEKMNNQTEHEIEHAIVESAIVFWFKDEDSKPNKVWNYFK